MQLVHITFASRTRHSLFPSTALRRRALHALARVLRDRLVLFCIVDDHVHVVVFVEPGTGALIAGHVTLAFRALASVELAPPHVKPVDGRRHLESLVRYLLGQTDHHAIATPSHRWEGSCLPDLLGARCLPGVDLRAQLAQALPRLDDHAIIAMVDLHATQVQPASLAEVRDLGAVALASACQAATAAAAPWGKERPAVHARAAVIRIGQAAGISTADLARACRVSTRAARYRGRVQVADETCRAALRQLRLMQATPRPLHAGPAPG